MRLARLSRVVWLVYRQQKGIKASARQLVSQNRRRFNKDGFDIDITYVTDRIIAMSVPAVAVEAMYRYC
jgi:PTEN phosphatase family protein